MTQNTLDSLLNRQASRQQNKKSELYCYIKAKTFHIIKYKPHPFLSLSFIFLAFVLHFSRRACADARARLLNFEDQQIFQPIKESYNEPSYGDTFHYEYRSYLLKNWPEYILEEKGEGIEIVHLIMS